jgi:hypothetical protein
MCELRHTSLLVQKIHLRTSSPPAETLLLSTPPTGSGVGVCTGPNYQKRNRKGTNRAQKQGGDLLEHPTEVLVQISSLSFCKPQVSLLAHISLCRGSNMLKKIEAEASLENCRALIKQINAGLSAEEPFMNVSSAAEVVFYLEFAASLLKSLEPHARESKGRRSPSRLSVAPTAPRL